MRQDYPNLGIKQLCGLFGKTRHAFYDMGWREKEQSIENAIVLELVKEVREEMPRLGTEKLYPVIKDSLQKHKIKKGRDKLHTLLQVHNLTIRKKRRRTITTDSNHNFRKYPNLIRNLTIEAPERLWVCDITYITLTDRFCYLSLITDAYSRKIVGHCLSPRLDNQGCINALKMALLSRTYKLSGLIHHSDRGLQYCSHQYVNILIESGIMISMTENGDPYENAMAERVNGILKTEFNLSKTFTTFEDALNTVERSITIYNEKRPHASCDFLTPEKAHDQTGQLKKRWKKRVAKGVINNSQ